MGPPRRSWVVAVAAALGLSACARELPPVERVILITIDTLRADHLGSYGYPRRVSEFLDELAEDSTLFERAISSSSHTGPSHASMMTGLYPKQHGVMTNLGRLREEATTIASVLAGAGYATAGFTAVRFLQGLEPGFGSYTVPHWRVPGGWLPARTVVDRSLRWLEKRPAGDRYFLWLHIFEPHEWPRVEPSTRGALSPPSDDELLAYLREEHGMDPRWNPSMGALGAIDRYDGLIRQADRELARLHAELERRGDLERSLLIVTADHGEGLGSHRTSGHGIHLYQEQIRVPLLIRLDGAGVAGTRVPDLVRHVDLLPTISEVTGVAIPDTEIPLQGRSLVPLLAGTEDGPPRRAFAQRRPADEARLEQGWAPGDLVSLQDQRYKYLLATEADDELYDLVNDPLELDNLLAREFERPRDLRNLRAALVEMNDRMVRQASESLLLDDSHLDALRALGYVQ